MPPVQRAVRVAVPPPPPKRLQVVTPKDPSETRRPEAPPTDSGAGARPEGRTGLIVLAVAALLLILNFATPWYARDPFGDDGFVFAGDSISRGELKENVEGRSLYHTGLHLWPLLALIGAFVAGAGLLAVDRLALAQPLARASRLAGLLACALFAFIVALSGVRLIGYALSIAWSGEGTLKPHVAVYANLLGGLGLAAIALWRLRGQLADASFTPAMRTTAFTTAITAGALLLHPLLPLARIVRPADDLHLSEWHVADSALGQTGDDFSLAVGMVWILLYLGLLTFAAAIADRERGSRTREVLVHAYALGALPLLVGVIFTALLYTHLAEDTFGLDVRLGFNYVLALVYVALIVIYAKYVRRVLLPFLESNAAAPGEASDLYATR